MAAKTDLGRASSRTLEKLRLYRDLTNQQLAELTGFSEQTIRNRCSGATTITTDDIEVLARALDVEPFVLLMDFNRALQWTVEHRPSRWITASEAA